MLLALEASVAALAAWVAAYVPTVLLGWPLVTAYRLFPLALAVALLVLAPGWRRAWGNTTPTQKGFAGWVVVTALCPLLLVLLTNRPDADDATIYHRAQVDALDPSAPPASVPFQLASSGDWRTVRGLAKIRAWEPAVTAAAHALGVDPVQAYHNLFAAGIAVVWWILYAALFRQLGLRGANLWIAMASLVAALMLDASFHRSFGNMTLLRIWQGKILAFAVLYPLCLLFALRFLDRPSPRRLGLLTLVACTAPWINRSALLLELVLGLGLGFAHAAVHGFRKPHLGRASAVAMVLCAPAGLAAAGLATLSPRLLMRIFGDAFSAGVLTAGDWWHSLGKWVWNAGLLARDAVLLTAVPLVAGIGRQGRQIAISQAAIAVLCFAPWAGPLWFRVLGEPGYWRFYMALAVPLSFGLLGVAMARRGGDRRRWLVVVMVLATWVAGFERSTLSSANRVAFKAPWDARLPAQDLALGDRLAPHLVEGRVLAPGGVAWVLAVTAAGQVDLVMTQTRDRGHRSTLASRVLERCVPAVKGMQALSSYLDEGVDRLVTACDASTVQSARPGLLLELVETVGEYRIYRIVSDRASNSS